MKKIFIGCGIVVLLLLGGVAFLAWRLWPDIRALRDDTTAAITTTNALAAAHPFDPAAHEHLDTERFALALDLRAQLSQDRLAINRDLEELDQTIKDGKSDVGTFEAMSRMVRATTSVYTGLANRLQAAQMSWPEFAWHVRLFWTVLARVDVGAGEPELESLRGEETRFEKLYEVQRSRTALPQLRDLLGVFPPAVVSEAAAVMATDLARVREGLGAREVERDWMLPKTQVEQLSFDQFPEFDKDRIEAEKAAREAEQPEPAAPPK